MRRLRGHAPGFLEHSRWGDTAPFVQYVTNERAGDAGAWTGGDAMERWLALSGSALLAVILAGCGGRVVVDTDASAGTGGKGTGTGAGGGSTSTGAGGAAPLSCERMFDVLGISVLNGGAPDNCEASAQLFYEGVVVKSGNNGLIVDTCAPGTPCTLDHVIIDVFAPGLGVFIPEGTFVSVAVGMVNMGWGCAENVLVMNLPSFAGMPNPTSPNPILWLAAADGTLATLPGSPFAVHETGDCPLQGPEGVHDFALQITPLAAPASSITVSMGQGDATTLPNGETWLARNLRSFRDESLPATAAEMDFAYWVVQK